VVEDGGHDGDVGQVAAARQLRVVAQQHVALPQALVAARTFRAPVPQLHTGPRTRSVPRAKRAEPFGCSKVPREATACVENASVWPSHKDQCRAFVPPRGV